MADIDELSIKIEASAAKAMPEIEKLIKNLSSLSVSLTKTGGTSVRAFTGSINAMTRSVAAFNSVIKALNLSDVESKLRAISKINLSNLEKKFNIDIKMNGATETQRQAEAIRLSTERVNEYLARTAENIIRTYGVTGREAKALVRKMTSDLADDNWSTAVDSLQNKLKDSLFLSPTEIDALMHGQLESYKNSFDNELQEFVKYIRSRKIKITDAIRGDAVYAGYVGRGGEFNNIFDNKKGLNLGDSHVYAELQQNFPGLFQKVAVEEGAVQNLLDHIVNLLRQASAETDRVSLSTEQYRTAAHSILGDLEEAGRAITEIRSHANTPDSLYLDVKINEEKLQADIASAVNRIASMKYGPVNIDLKVDVSTIRNSIESQLKGINPQNIASIAESLKELNRVGANLSVFSGLDISKFAKNLEKLSKIDHNNLLFVAHGMANIAKANQNFDNVSSNTLEVTEFVKALSKFGNKKIETAIVNIPLLGDAINDMLTKLAKAPAVSQQTINAITAAGSVSPAQLSAAGSMTRSAMRSSGGGFGRSLSGAMKSAFHGLSGVTGRIGSSISGSMKTIWSGFGNVLVGVKTGAVQAASGLKGFLSSLQNANRGSRSLTTSLGMLYAKFWTLRRAINLVSTSFKSSMDFIETYHYFDVAMTKIGEDNRDLWAQYGYDSAESYVQSFSKRALELNEKMTGYVFDEYGYGKSNGLKNLGLSADLVMQYQAQYAQMADSIGMSGEAALATSKAMTMLAGDWSSLKNISFESSFQKMASALAGQSRAVRSLGIDITQTALQQQLYDLGIDVSISKLNQAQKAQVRMIAILKQSQVAYGDLAKTINTPANQLRMLEENTKSLARTIGNLFLPIVQKVLPLLNGIIIALRTIFEWIATLLGVDISKIVTSTADIDINMDDFSDSVGDAADALEEAEEEAEKLKKTILGFDELHILNGPDTKDEKTEDGKSNPLDNGLLDIALLDALGAYERAWNEAFDKVSSKAQEFADKILGAARKIYDYFKAKDWEALGNYIAGGINGGLKKAYDWITTTDLVAKASGFMSDLANALNSIIDKVDFYKIGRIIGAGLNSWTDIVSAWYRNFDAQNFGRRIASIINGFFDEVRWEDLGRMLGMKFQNLIDTIRGFLENLRGFAVGKSIAELINGWFDGIKWDALGRTLASGVNKLFEILNGLNRNLDWNGMADKVSNGINSFIHGIRWKENGTILGQFVNNLVGFITRTIEQFDWRGLGIGVTRGLNYFIDTVDWYGNGYKIASSFSSILNGLNAAIENFHWKDLGHSLSRLMQGLVSGVDWITLGKVLGGAYNGAWNIFSGFVLQSKKFRDLGEGLGNAINAAMGKIDTKMIGTTLAKAWNNAFKFLRTAITTIHWSSKDILPGQSDDSIATKLTNGLNSAIDHIDLQFSAETINELAGKLLNGLEEIRSNVKWEEFGEKIGSAIKEIDWWKHLTAAVDHIKGILGELFIGAIKGIFGDVGENFAQGFIDGISGILDFNKDIIEGIGNALSKLFEALNKIDPEIIRKIGEALGVLFGIGITYTFSTKILSLVGALTSFGTVAGGTIAGSTFPSFIKLLASAFGRLVSAGKNIVKYIIDAEVFSKLTNMLGELVSAGKNITQHIIDADVFSKLGTIFTDFASSIESSGILNVLGGLAEGSAIVGAVQLGAELQKINEGAMGGNGILSEYGGAIDTLREKLIEAEPRAKGVADEVFHIKESLEDSGAPIDEWKIQLGTAFYESGISAEALWTAISGVKEATNLTSEQVDILEGIWAEYNKFMDESGDKTDEVAKKMDFSKAVNFSKINVSIKDFCSSISDSFYDLSTDLGISEDQWGRLNTALTDLSKKDIPVNEAFSVIARVCEETGISVGTLIKAIGENFPGSISRLKISVGEMKDKLGETKSETGFLKDAMDFLNTSTGNVRDTILNRLKPALSNISYDSLKTSAEGATTANNNLDTGIGSFLLSMGKRALDFLVACGMYTGLTTAIDGTKESAEGVPATIDESAKKVKNEVAPNMKDASKAVGEAIPEGLAEGIESQENHVENLVGRLGGSVTGAFARVLEIQSPSRVMYGYGENFVQGFINALSAKASALTTATSSLKYYITNPLENMDRTTSPYGQNVVNGLISGMQTATNSVINVSNSIRRSITQPFDNIWSTFDAIGRQAINGLSNGMRWTHITLPHIRWNWNTITYGNGQWVQVPDFFTEWYAKGGLFTTPTIAGFGEAGDEAALPLTNKGVMAKIANAIVDAGDGFSGMSQDDMMEAVSMGVAMAMAQNPQTVEVVVNALLKTDDEKIAQSVARGQAKLNQRYNATPSFGF